MSKGYKSKRTDLKPLMNNTSNNIHVSILESLTNCNKISLKNSKFISILSSSGNEVVMVVPVVIAVVLGVVGGVCR